MQGQGAATIQKHSGGREAGLAFHRVRDRARCVAYLFCHVNSLLLTTWFTRVLLKCCITTVLGVPYVTEGGAGAIQPGAGL